MIIVNHEQGTPAWRLWRRAGIGGSDVAAILGLCPEEWKVTRETLLAEKVTGRERETTFSMREGNRMEPVAREMYMLSHGCEAAPVCVEHGDAPWVRCSLDGLCRHRPRIAGAKPWVLEIKFPNWRVHNWALNGRVPDYYAVQCQWQLLCTGLDRCDFVSLTKHSSFAEKDRIAVVTLHADKQVQQQCLEAAEPFWEQVLAGRERLAEERRARHMAAAGAV